MPEVRVLPTPEALGSAVAGELLGTLAALTREVTGRKVDLALAGGSVNSLVLARVAQLPHPPALDWSRVRVWWVDERFVPSGDEQRNDREAYEALLGELPDVETVPWPHQHGTLSLEEAGAQFSTTWASLMGGRAPDLSVVGCGPDGHFASLFPGHTSLDAPGPVLVEHESPKPPPHRLTLARDTVVRSHQLWLVAAGASKASVVQRALVGADLHEVPIAALATDRAVWWLDRAAAPHARGDGSGTGNGS